MPATTHIDTPNQTVPNSSTIGMWLKIPYTLFMLVLVPVYWLVHGPQNFLWGCDIALFLALLAMWREWSLPASMAILITLVPDVVWNLDLLARLAGFDLLGVNATAYMFDSAISPGVRALSLFHVFLVPLLLWIIYRIGYDRRALPATLLLTATALLLSYFFSDPDRNINWAHGLGTLSPPWPTGLPHLLALWLLAFVFFNLPVHLLLGRYLGRTAP